MGEISFIETSEVPVRPRAHNGARVQLAEDTLRRAMQQNKTVRVILDGEERAQSVINPYRAAAKRIGIGLFITGGPRRPYVNQRGREDSEPSILYFTFTKIKTPTSPSTNGHMRPPVSPGEAQRVFAHGVEVTR